MTNILDRRSSNEKVSPAFIKGSKARRYSDGFQTDYQVDLIPQTGKAGKKCSYCNRSAIWLYTPINKTNSTAQLTFWRCYMCLTEEEREIIKHTYYILGDVTTSRTEYGKRLYTKV